MKTKSSITQLAELLVEAENIRARVEEMLLAELNEKRESRGMKAAQARGERRNTRR